MLTGATGGVGYPVVQALLSRGDEVVALVRDLDDARLLLPEQVHLARGDLLDPASILDAMDGADWVIHAAGMPEQWVPDDAVFDRVHRIGTRNVLEAARTAHVFRVLHVSTMDVFACARGGTLSEEHPDPEPKPTAYERSKVAAEREVDDAVRRGLDVVVINPGAVYGTGPSRVGMNRLILDAIQGRTPLLPPGGASFVFNEGLALAMIAALERGQMGRRYLVADGYAEIADFVRTAVGIVGRGSVPPTGPLPLLRIAAGASDLAARWLGVPALVSQGELTFLRWQARIDTTRAREELGFQPTPLPVGLTATLASLFPEERALPGRSPSDRT